MNKKIDLTGQRFGRLIVLKESHFNEKQRHHFWACRCDCGNETIVRQDRLTRKSRNESNGNGGITRSCGCLRKEMKDIGFEKNLEKNIYKGSVPSKLNDKLPRNNTSGVKGVSFSKASGKWIAHIGFKGEKIRLGSFVKNKMLSTLGKKPKISISNRF